MMSMSDSDTARMSPKRKPTRSMRTQVMKATMTRPIDSAECERMPSSASVDSAPRRCRNKSRTDTAAATMNTATIRLRSRSSDSATPSSAECAMVSPK
ncbi:hypothetical protein D9M72_605290 [compost metagenome]